jgi:hypothetical protein
MLLLTALASPVYAGDDWTGHASLLFSKKSLDSKDWKGADDSPSSGGLITDFKKQSWPVSIAIDLIGSDEDKTIQGKRTEATIGELDLGVRKIWALSSLPISPYIGGGVAFVDVEKTVDNNKQKKDDVGAWAGIGVYWNITERFTLGADMRYTKAEVKLAGQKVDAGGLNTGISLGLNW